MDEEKSARNVLKVLAWLFGGLLFVAAFIGLKP